MSTTEKSVENNLLFLKVNFVLFKDLINILSSFLWSLYSRIKSPSLNNFIWFKSSNIWIKAILVLLT